MSLKRIYTFLFFLGIFFIPFNEFEGLSFLGEYSDEAATYFFLAGFGLLIIESTFKEKINIPYKNSLALLLAGFVLWSIISTLLSLPTVLESYFKQTSGVSRFIRQFISLSISALIFTIFFWNAIRNFTVYNAFIQIRRVLLYSFIFVSIYGFIEIAIVFFGMGFLRPLLQSFDAFPFVNYGLHSNWERRGISSVTFEIPALATYLIMVFPWMISYIFTEKKLYKYLPLGVILILIFFSDSRSGLIVIAAQLALLGLLMLLDPKYSKGTKQALKYGLILFAGLLLINSKNIYETVQEKSDRLNFSKNLTKSISNKSRFGIQYATYKVFEENPIAGVGLGQNTYHAMHHYPYWATHKNWEFRLRYKNQQLKSFPPNFNFYTRTMAELGLTGLLLFAGLISLCLYYSFLIWKKSNDKYRFAGVILLISFVGMAINWAQMDSFKQYGFWISLILLIKFRMNFKKIMQEEKELISQNK